MKRLIITLILAITATPILLQANDYDESWWPTATPDSANTVSGEAVTIPVLGNDLGIKLTLRSVNTTTVKFGSATLSADKQSVIYQSAKGFSGTDTFWYDFEDAKGRANAAMVTVEVSSSGDDKPLAWPTAGYDTATTTVNTAIEIDVLNNDEGVGLSLTEVNTTTVKLGSAIINEDSQTIQYTPPAGFTGSDEFWYVFNDQWGRTNAGKISLMVDNKTEYSGGWPTAVPDNAATLNTESVIIPVLDNDLGLGLTLTKTNTTTVKLGKTVIDGDKILYSPPAGFTGEDSFWYDFEDSQGRANSTQVFVSVSDNATLSTIAFCGSNYRTNGTKAGTFITDEKLTIQETRIDKVGSNIFTAPAPDLAVIGDRRYYTVEDSTAGSVSVMLEEAGETKTITAFPIEFAIRGFGVYDGIFFFTAYQQTYSNFELYMHDESGYKALGIYATNLRLLTNLSAPYFSTVTFNDSGILENKYLRLDENRREIIKVAAETIANNVDQTIPSIFYKDGIDYITKYSDIISRTTSLIQQNSDGDVLSRRPANVDKAIINEGRLLFTTIEHTDRIGEVSGFVETTYPAKLFTVNANQEIIELAVCE